MAESKKLWWIQVRPSNAKKGPGGHATRHEWNYLARGTVRYCRVDWCRTIEEARPTPFRVQIATCARCSLRYNGYPQNTKCPNCDHVGIRSIRVIGEYVDLPTVGRHKP